MECPVLWVGGRDEALFRCADAAIPVLLDGKAVVLLLHQTVLHPCFIKYCVWFVSWP